MKKAGGFTFIIFILANTMSAQPDSLAQRPWSKFVFSIYGSRVNPYEQFADFNSTGCAGIPVNGWGGKMETDYFFNKFIGITGSFVISSNATIAPSRNQLFPTYSGGGLGGGSTITTYAYKSGKWESNNFLVGLIGRVGEGRIEFLYRLSAGLQQIKSPETRIDGNGYSWRTGQPTQNYEFHINQPSMTSNTLVVDFGLDLKVKILKGFAVLGGFDVLNSYAHFEKNDPHIQLLFLNIGLCYGIR